MYDNGLELMRASAPTKNDEFFVIHFGIPHYGVDGILGFLNHHFKNSSKVRSGWWIEKPFHLIKRSCLLNFVHVEIS